MKAESQPRRLDNFNALRLLAAVLVIIGHSFVLLGLSERPSVLGIRLDALGLAIFFSLSGYMIVQSWQRLQSGGRFFWHRALRIFPALWVVLLISTFVLGPLVTLRPLDEYFQSAQTWSYLLLSGALLAQYELPGVFEDLPRTAVNGSLWTLGVEFLCYALVAFIGIGLRKFAHWGLVAFGLAGAVISIAGDTLPILLALQDAARVSVYFAVGGLVAYLLPFVRVSARVGAGALGVWFVAWMLVPSAEQVWAWLLLPLVVVAVGSASTPAVRQFGRFGDFSYGIYLWGFPIQQLVVTTLGALPLVLNLLLVLPATVAIAAASWHLIEKRALRLKSVQPAWSRGRWASRPSLAGASAET